MTVSYAVRVDEDIRDRASEVARHYGLDLASATRAFWTQMANTGCIPLSFSYEEPNEASLEAIRETEEIFANGGGRRFKSVDALVSALEA
ncbi:MAG: type II toxin-antitoxin system RelB/DinJ family antitoxin [Atopobiaceae bacterium]|nr:type II toxin-antitoxin system RelB/DinJ family antitoxin [Atopobiaceae bacterium]